MKKYLLPILTVSLLIGVIIVGRAIPHWPNFAPVAAAGLFAGYLFRKQWLALAVPILGMGISDLIFGGMYDWSTMIFVYIGLSLPALLGVWVHKAGQGEESKIKQFFARSLRVFTVGASASVFFFVVSNLAVWMFSPMYGISLKGLMACYLAAIPFFKFTLAGDLFFSALFFGVLGMASLMVPNLKHSFALVRK